MVSSGSTTRTKGLKTHFASTVLLCLLLGGCAVFAPPDPHIGDAVPYKRVPGWGEDDAKGVLAALGAQCVGTQRTAAALWCGVVAEHDNETSLLDTLSERFEARRVYGESGARDGLITGYYEPLLRGSEARSERYRWPLYRAPKDLVTLDLASRYPALEGNRVRGRLDGQRVVPYWTRAEIDGEDRPLAGEELLWVDDPVDAFFLQVQGSGIVALDNGNLEAIGYSDQNGHRYVSIGRVLVERGELPLEAVSLFSIRDWLDRNPQQAQALLNENPSYVFFDSRGAANAAGPLGTLGVPLTPERSVAVDPDVIPLGSLLWLDTELADGTTYRRLVVAQDTGGAINGGPRADIFFGRGQRAEQLAGTQRSRGRLYVLTPRDVGD